MNGGVRLQGVRTFRAIDRWEGVNAHVALANQPQWRPTGHQQGKPRCAVEEIGQIARSLGELFHIIDDDQDGIRSQCGNERIQR